MTEPDEYVPLIFIIESTEILSAFYQQVSMMSNADYDIVELIDKIIRTMDTHSDIDDNLESLISYYVGKMRANDSENLEADIHILEPAVRSLFNGLRAKLHYFDIYDEFGVSKFYFATLRNEDIIIAEKSVKRIVGSEGVYIPYGNRPFTETIENRVSDGTSLNHLISPDAGYDYSVINNLEE